MSVSHMPGSFLEKVSWRDATWFGDSRILFISSPDTWWERCRLSFGKQFTLKKTLILTLSPSSRNSSSSSAMTMRISLFNCNESVTVLKIELRCVETNNFELHCIITYNHNRGNTSAIKGEGRSNRMDRQFLWARNLQHWLSSSIFLPRSYTSRKPDLHFRKYGQTGSRLLLSGIHVGSINTLHCWILALTSSRNK